MYWAGGQEGVRGEVNLPAGGRRFEKKEEMEKGREKERKKGRFEEREVFSTP